MDDRAFEWDERKRTANRAKHGLDFELVRRFEWDTAIAVEDARWDYGELRRRAYGLIDGRLCALVFTVRGETVRVISLRRAHAKETRRYGL